MKNKMKLANYIKSRKTKYEDLGRELHFLESIRLPLRIEDVGKEFILYSYDYSLATNFKIKKRNEYVKGYSDPGGGYGTERHYLYPQFYFNLKRDCNNLQVLVQHEGFLKDERIVVRSSLVTRGYGTHADENRSINHWIDLEKVLSFFKKKGVGQSLLDKLQGKVEEIDSLYIG